MVTTRSQTAGVDEMIQFYDEKASAIAEFDGQTSRIFQSDENDKAWLDLCTASWPEASWPTNTRFATSQLKVEFSKIHHGEELDRLPNFTEAAFFAQSTLNSFSRISPSKELFDALTTKFNVTPRLREFAMSFGIKRREVDFGPPTLRFRAVNPAEDGHATSFECIYGFRYAFNTNGERPGDNTWSIRQTAVYQKFDAKEEHCIWIFLGASRETKSILQENFQRRAHGFALNPCLLHAMIIENSLGQWRWYIIDLAERVRSMTQRFALSDISATTPEERVNISVSFADRQRLKSLEDDILNLHIMLQSTAQTITSLKSHCSTMTTTHARSIDQTPILNLLTEALNQANAYLVKAEVLRKQVKGATTLLTDILTYDNAFVLKVLAEEARIDNVAMVRLSAQAAEDSSAIRIITIITVIFLPATVVSVSLYLLSAPPKLTESMQSFFSTQFVHIEVDSFRLSKSTWIYFAVTAVLTLITIGNLASNHQTQSQTESFGNQSEAHWDLEISSEQYLPQATLCIAIKISPQKPLHCVIFEGVGRTLFKRMQEEIFSFCAKKSLNRVYELSIDYQAGTRPERCRSQAAFDKIFGKIILQRCNSFQVTALLSGTKCARTTITAWQRALDILTHQRIKKDNNKYIVRTGSWLKFCRDSSLLDSICCEQEEMREIFDDRTSFLDLKDNGIKLFAIFILVQRSNSAVVFRDFWNGGCRDADLPFVYFDQYTCCEDLLMWTALYKGVAPCRFLEDQVLPFQMGKILGKGGYATVFEITLDDDHSEIYEAFRACEFDVGKLKAVKNPPLAAKIIEEIPDNLRILDNRETTILATLADFKHPHLIQLITAFYHGNKYYMIFPKARTSLRDMFKNEEYTGNTSYLLWLLRQLTGLAGGIDKFHTGAINSGYLGVPTEREQKGFHGDIAAANILNMDTLCDLSDEELSYGRMQICDFGIGKMVDKQSIAISVVSNTNRGQSSYAPPEATIIKEGVPTQSRWRDIWSFGCVVFEICLWLLEGKAKLAEFSSEKNKVPEDISNPGDKVPTYHHLAKENGTKQQEIKPEVQATMQRLRKGGSWPPETWPQIKDAVNEVLDLVEKCWTIAPINKRPDAAQLKKDLQAIAIKFASKLEATQQTSSSTSSSI
ncbi:hypothetical protein EG328_009755 [Venturia inaequalis]|uniref:Protein kinase domain-containing protein n=1 Tax=Venturia inaequalis TaxID=5025 RepID=A0A8H3V9J3_VENIN|nr:hypothetical protein EG328_009755 [Venturia inaequalis]